MPRMRRASSSSAELSLVERRGRTDGGAVGGGAAGADDASAGSDESTCSAGIGSGDGAWSCDGAGAITGGGPEVRAPPRERNVSVAVVAVPTSASPITIFAVTDRPALAVPAATDAAPAAVDDAAAALPAAAAVAAPAATATATRA